MKPLISLLLLLSTAYAAEVDQMAQALRNEGLNSKAVNVLLRHAKLESQYGTKGIAKGTLNWWNRTTYTGGRVDYEYEHGKLVKKRWVVYKTYQEAAREQIKFLCRRYPGAISKALLGDWKGYRRVLRKKGYFGKVERR